MSTTEAPEVEIPETQNDAGEGAAEAEKSGGKKQMSFSVLEDGTIQATFGEGIDPLRLHPEEVPEQTRMAAITEGLISRTRGYTSKLEGAERTPENLRIQVEKGFNALRAGVWKIEREATEVFTVEIEAAHLFRKLKAASKGEAYSETVEQVAEIWAKLTDEQKATVKALPRYQQAMAEIKAQRALERARKLAKKADEAEANAPL